ncbi:anti-sigma factor [Rhodocytophaga aerolata]|uniref:Anti-sigma factor n=1 Tax=Rhodocytophaga aerolata TaxID=455078 RepID=A0ABT8RBN4_9BACT|nr:anti-sigma factor [Rhodocytophaga aerolata]MDO1448120.1 anti-sigma factor [Rhodocytophaga aerolata]
MDIQAYIASGVLESYVLGIASPEETAEVERLAKQYPQIKAEIEAIRASLEAYIMQHEQVPPASLKKKIWYKLEQLDTDEVSMPEEISLNSSRETKTGRNFTMYWLAAAVTGFILSIGLNAYLYNQLTDTKQQLAAATTRNQSLSASLQVRQTDYTQALAELEILRNPDNRPIFLGGQEPAPGAAVMVYWNKDKQQVHLAVHNLPAPSPDKQYQLWAIVDGKPVDAGMLELKEQGPQLQKMKNIGKAEAFAITLEKKGGNPTPEGQIYVLGKV